MKRKLDRDGFKRDWEAATSGRDGDYMRHIGPASIQILYTAPYIRNFAIHEILLNHFDVQIGKQGQGYGSKALDVLTGIADRRHIDIVLHAHAFKNGLSQDDLTAFYERHGFIGTGKLDNQMCRFSPKL